MDNRKDKVFKILLRLEKTGWDKQVPFDYHFLNLAINNIHKLYTKK